MNFIRAGFATLAIAALGGCATSSIEQAWVDPAATPQSFEVERVLAIASAPDGAIRRAAEDALVAALTSGPRGTSGKLTAKPSYTLLDAGDLADVKAARPKVEAAGYDAAVLIAFVSSQEQITVTPPSYSGYHGGFWGHYGYAYGAMGYDPGYVRQDTILRLQISIYSLRENKLLWSGVSRTLNPDRIDEMIQEIADAVADDLRKRGLIT